jgi:hypothetical protein
MPQLEKLIPQLGKIIPQLDILVKIFTLLYTPIIIYIWGTNIVIVTTIVLNKDNPLELVIGWEGVSITPVMSHVVQSTNNSFLLFLVALGVYTVFTLGVTFLYLQFFAPRNSLEALAALVGAVLCVYTAGHLMLEAIVLIHNCGMAGLEGVSFELGSENVRLSPHIPPPGVPNEKGVLKGELRESNLCTIRLGWANLWPTGRAAPGS